MDIPQLYDPARPVYIVGGGASLKEFNFQRLADKQVLAIKDAYRFCKDAAILFFADAGWYHQQKDPWEEKSFWRFRGKYIATTVPELEGKLPAHISFLTSDQKIPFGRSSVAGKWRNSGYQAINLAYLAGARTVVLLGFDASPGRWASAEDTTREVYRMQLPHFDELAAYIKRRIKGYTVINANPDSAIEGFDKMPLDAALSLSNPQSE